MPLTVIEIKSAKPRDKAFKISDGGGLHLLVQPHGSKLWRLAYRYHGKQKLLSFGPFPAVSLVEFIAASGGPPWEEVRDPSTREY